MDRQDKDTNLLTKIVVNLLQQHKVVDKTFSI